MWAVQKNAIKKVQRVDIFFENLPEMQVVQYKTCIEV